MQLDRFISELGEVPGWKTTKESPPKVWHWTKLRGRSEYMFKRLFQDDLAGETAPGSTPFEDEHPPAQIAQFDGLGAEKG